MLHVAVLQPENGLDPRLHIAVLQPEGGLGHMLMLMCCALRQFRSYAAC